MVYQIRRIGMNLARAKLTELVESVRFSDTRIHFTRHEKVVGVLISQEDARKLAHWERECAAGRIRAPSPELL